jgi:hypothetical protein
MQLQPMFEKPPEITEKDKTLMTLEDFCYKTDKLREVLNGIKCLLAVDMLGVVEAQLKTDQAIDKFNAYLQKGGEGY